MKTRSAMEAAGKVFRTNGISERVKKIIVSPIKEMRIIAQDYENVISFGQGIPYLDTPKPIKEKAAKLLLETDVSKYSVSPGALEVRQKVAVKLKQFGINANPKTEILMTVGAMEGIFTAVMTIVNPGDEVILFTPGFSSHIEQVLLAGGIPVFSNLKESNDWAIDINNFKNKITKKTKAVIINNPNNPTGCVYNEKELQEIAKICLEKGIIIICDDPYNFLLYDNAKYFSIASLKKMKNNIIACFSFSKEFAMTGYRLGYVYAAEGIINQMMKVHDACTICAPVISQHTGIIALDAGKNISNGIIKAMNENRSIMMKGLDAMKKYVDYNVPKGAYYIFIKFKKKMDSVDLSIDILKKAKVELVPGSAFGPMGEDHLRLSFAGKPDKIKEGMRRLKKYFENN